VSRRDQRHAGACMAPGRSRSLRTAPLSHERCCCSQGSLRRTGGLQADNSIARLKLSQVRHCRFAGRAPREPADSR
jgi:hypothetical protein